MKEHREWNHGTSFYDDQAGESIKECTLFLGRVLKGLLNWDLIVLSQPCTQGTILETFILPIKGGKHAKDQYSVSLPLSWSCPSAQPLDTSDEIDSLSRGSPPG